MINTNYVQQIENIVKIVVSLQELKERLNDFHEKDIAFEFASAISPVFKLYLIKEFQRLKEAVLLYIREY